MKEFVILAAILLSVARAEFQAPFQVSIQIKNQPSQNESDQHQICNGIIIHEEYILTTANCLYLPIANTDLSFQVPASAIIVVAGFRKSSNMIVQRNVVSIIPHHNFSKTTNDNDIAVLKLDNGLPLVNNMEIQWLDIANGNAHYDSSCFSTVFTNAQQSEEFYSISRQPLQLKSTMCDENANSNETDLCLEYSPYLRAFCNSSSASLKYSDERGTAYVCNNKLVGILADINSPTDVEKCFSGQHTTAFYVNVTMHLEWLLNEVGILQLGNINRPDGSTIPSWTAPTVDVVTTTTAKSTKSRANEMNIPKFIFLFMLLITFIAA